MSDDESDLVESLLDEFVARLRRGESPSIAAYEAAHPECAAQIREFFPAVQAMEELALRRPHNHGSAPMPGMPEQLGDFCIVREIGRGGMGVVYEAQQASLSRHVAVKVLPPSALNRPAMLRRFQREAQTAARLHHTNIVPVFGVGEDHGFHYIVMQLIQGVGLDKILARLAANCPGDLQTASGRSLPSTVAIDPRNDETTAVVRAMVRGEFERKSFSGTSSVSLALDAGPPAADKPTGTSPATTTASLAALQPPLPDPGADRLQGEPVPPPIATGRLELGPKYWQSVARIGVQAASALQYAHQRRTLHRDIKPANLLVDLQGVVWISDFGLAKAIEQDDVSQTGDIVGTLRYMAPERFHGQADARSDIYSLGLTLYELLTLRPAYEHASPSILIQKIGSESPIRPRKLRPAIPRDLETIVMKAAAREPDHRYRSAAELADDLERFLDDRPVQARRVSVIERVWRWSRRNRAVASLAGVALALLVLVAAVASVGYIRTRIAHRQTRDALAREALEREVAQSQREKAEALSELTLATLDDIFEEFVPNRVAGVFDLSLGDADETNVRAPVQPVLSKGAAALLERMLVFYERLSQQNAADAGLRRKVADANRRVGDIHRRLGQWDQAEAAYLKSIEGYRQLERDAPDGHGAAAEIARIYNELGNLHWTARRPGEGRAFHVQAMEILKAAASADAAAAPVRYELARTYYFLGRGGPPDAPPGRGPPGGKPPRPGPDRRGPPDAPPRDRARRADAASLRTAIELLERLVVEHPAVADYRHLLACCYRELPAPAATSAAQPAFDSADKAIAILRQLVADFPDVPDYRYDLSKTYARVEFGDPPFDPRLYNILEDRLRQSLSISQKLIAEHPHVPDYMASHVQALYGLATVERRTHRGEAAEATLRKALAVQSSLVEQFPQAGAYQAWKVVLQESLARLISERGRPGEARTLLESSVTTLEQLLKADPQAAYLHDLLGRCYKNLADVLDQLGDHQRAQDMLRRGREHRTE